MTEVWFRCDGKHTKMFLLNTKKEMIYVPIIGDTIETCKSDFVKSSFRVKPFFYDKNNKMIKNEVCLTFKVISRRFIMSYNKWELICEPTSGCLLFLLGNLKIK